jgi:hypothetical protein
MTTDQQIKSDSTTEAVVLDILKEYARRRSRGKTKNCVGQGVERAVE